MSKLGLIVKWVLRIYALLFTGLAFWDWITMPYDQGWWFAFVWWILIFWIQIKNLKN